LHTTQLCYIYYSQVTHSSHHTLLTNTVKYNKMCFFAGAIKLINVQHELKITTTINKASTKSLNQ